MYLDFHTHGKLAKKLPFSTAYTDWLFGEAKGAGLDALCLTEHFNTLQFDEVYGYLLSRCEREGDTLVTEDGLRIFAGMETDIAEGGHILSIGTPEEILELNRRLEPHKEKDSFLPFAELIELFSGYSVLVGAGHPFREGKDIAMDREETERKTYGLGKRLGLPVVAGSDTHQAVQYGCIRTCFEKEFCTAAEMKEEIRKGSYEIVVSGHAAFQVKTAGLLKRALKEIHALGGDYVGVLLGGGKEQDSCSFQDRLAVAYQTVVIDYSPKAGEMADRICLAANEMSRKGFELVSATTTGSAKGILVFRGKGM